MLCLNIFVCNPSEQAGDNYDKKPFHNITYYFLKKHLHFQFLKIKKTRSQQVFANKKVDLHNKEPIMCWVNHFFILHDYLFASK